MIPVPGYCLKKVELRVLPNDDKADVDYKNLLTNQLSWCNSNKELILKKAEKLYRLICAGNATESLLNRCCNFALDEHHCIEYSKLETAVPEDKSGRKKPSVRDELREIKAQQVKEGRTDNVSLEKSNGAR